jgi:sarcosine oxidase
VTAVRAFDAVVIGLGAMGSATVYHLARSGRRVLGLDMFPPGHVWGSSHGQHRMIRRSSYRRSHEPLIARAFELWPALEDESHRAIMHLFGEVALGYPRAGGRYLDIDLDPTLGGYREVLDETALRTHFPGFRLYEGMTATFERTAGILRPEVAIAAHLAVAERHGAVVRRPEEVVRWTVDGEGVVVETMAERYRAARLVVTTGPWAEELLAGLGLPLQVERIVNAYFAPERPDLWRQERGAPDFLLSVPEGSYYGMPDIGGVGLKIGRHENGEPTTARTIRREVAATEVQMLRDVLDRYMPGAGGAVRQTLTCMYTMTPDDDYIVERHPEYAQVVYGCGFSGTGFKFSCVIGELLAKLACAEVTTIDISAMGSSRFSASTVNEDRPTTTGLDRAAADSRAMS